MKYFNKKKNIIYLNYSKKKRIASDRISECCALKLDKKQIFSILWYWFQATAHFQKIISLVILHALIHESKVRKNKTYMTKFKIYFAKHCQMWKRSFALNWLSYLLYFLFDVSRVAENICAINIIEKYCSTFFDLLCVFIIIFYATW